MKVIVVGSGSSGNSTYIETLNAKILIDAGISLLQLKKRLANQGVILNRVDALFVTHEHGDHIKHLINILKATKAHLFIGKLCFNALPIDIKTFLKTYPMTFIDADVKYTINDCFVVPITLSHDSSSVFGYLFKSEIYTLGYVTDTGFIPPRYIPLLRHMKICIIESNHDVDMLINSNRHWSLKRRILSDIGHLSNKQCCDILRNIISPETKVIILAHLSRECNNPQMAYEENIKAFEGTKAKLYIASQDHELLVDEREIA